MRKVILFDMFGVLMEHVSADGMSKLAATTGALDKGITSEQFWEAWGRHRHEYDAGIISSEDYWQLVAKDLGVDLDWQAYEAAELHGFGIPDPAMIEWALSLKGPETQVAILSNIPFHMREGLYTELDFLADFDYRFYSCELKVAKPNPAFYQHALDEMKIAPEAVLFFDDNLENVAGAKKLGINAHQHLNLSESAEVAKEFLAN
ncbi:hypothetical protein BSR28_06705 [Boudabousia liubingyangii]|uniref:HAD family hydrolase n=1 Tax=Boudabousia liubingyangii TaxID=1921764 RepID=UPI00093A2EF0|nr:HAD family phosphatase [Boudabousia liubingyangii]OKL47089.1 hypothetical protein BSR28_06705 [Boudabousia liubingyangii]